MPNDTITAMGGRGSRPVIGGRASQPNYERRQLAPPRLGPPTQPVPSTDYFDQPNTQAPVAAGPAIRDVKVCPSYVQLHADWRYTALAPALYQKLGDSGQAADGPEVVVKLEEVTPEIFSSLAPATRQSLMESLAGGPPETVAWTDGDGKSHVRRHRLGLPIGEEYKVNPATALTMLLAASGDRDAYRQAMSAGLRPVVDELSGKTRIRLTASDVAHVLRQTFDLLGELVSPFDLRTELDAAGTLVRNYLARLCDETPATIETGMRDILGEMGPIFPHDPRSMTKRDAQLIGMAIGVVMAGGFMYVNDLEAQDNDKRWKVAALTNMVWAAQNFIPLPVVSGLTATTVVGAGILWDRMNPARNYVALIHQMTAELRILAMQGALSVDPSLIFEITQWITISLHANGYSA